MRRTVAADVIMSMATVMPTRITTNTVMTIAAAMTMIMRIITMTITTTAAAAGMITITTMAVGAVTITAPRKSGRRFRSALLSV